VKVGAPADPLVTVVVRSHGLERLSLARRAFFSVWSQDSAQSVELLFVTSGYRRRVNQRECVAHLGQASAGYRPAGPRLFRHLRFTLTGDTRARLLNAGLRAASGRYLIFLDDDDVLRQDALTRLLERAEKGADIVFGSVDIVFASKMQSPERQLIVPYAANPPKVLDLVRHNTAPLCSFLFRRPPPDRLPLVDEALCSFEDYAMLLQLLQSAAVASVGFARAVAEYWVENSAGSQVDKYRTTIAEDLERIEELRRRLTFPIRGMDMAEVGAAADQRRALAALLADLEEDRAESLQIHVDQVIETKFGFTYIGWLVDTSAESADVVYLFALQRDGGANLVDIRIPRAEVARRWRLAEANVGFAFTSREPCDRFFVVGGQRKRSMSAPQT
jgi:hypothetical protein